MPKRKQTPSGQEMRCPFPPGSHVSAYLRDSGGTDQDLSVQQQEHELREWCLRFGITLDHVFKDEARPGSTVVGRIGFEDMLYEFRRPNCVQAGLILWRYSRFARDFDDSAFYKADLRRRGFVVYALKDQIPDGPDGRMHEALIDWKNERFLIELSEEVQRGLKDLVKTYKCVPGTPPRGFKRSAPVRIGTRRDGKPHLAAQWIPDPLWVPKVKRAWEMREVERSYKEINDATHLYGSLNSYSTFFRNKLYLGILEYGDLVIEDYAKPMISQKTWDKVQAIEKRVTARGSEHINAHHPRRQASPYLLSGLLICGLCGSPMNGDDLRRATQSGETEIWRYYRCDRNPRRRDCAAARIPQAPIEKAVIDVMLSKVLTPGNIAALIKQINADLDHTRTTAQASIKQLTRQRAPLAKKVENLVKAIAELGHSKAMLDELHRAEDELEQLNSRLQVLEQVQTQKPLSLSSTVQDALLKDMRETLVGQDKQAARNVLRSFVDRVEVVKRDGRVEGEIFYTFPFPVETQLKPQLRLGEKVGAMVRVPAGAQPHSSSSKIAGAYGPDVGPFVLQRLACVFPE